MTEQSDKTTSVEQNKIKAAKNELSEQDLNRVTGGVGPVDAVKLNIGPVDGLKLPVGPIDGRR
jgi:hypothetical protein